MRATALLILLALGAAPPGGAADARAPAPTTENAPAPDERAVAEAARLLGPGFRRSETRHFVVLSDAGVGWTRARAALLERTRDQFHRASSRLGVPTRPPDAKLLCILFADHARYMAFARAHDGLDAAWVGGYFATATNRAVFYDDTSDPGLVAALERLDAARTEAASHADRARAADERRLLARVEAVEREADARRRDLLDRAARVSESKTIHEAVHLLAFNTGLQRRDRDYPFWLNEGLATSFETDDPGAAFGPDHPSDARDRRVDELARAGSLTPIPDLVVAAAAPADDADRADAMYHASYALFRHLYRRNRAALGAFITDFEREPPGPIASQRQRELFVRRFGDPAQVQRRLAIELNGAG